jgi:hypothetical protein
VAVDVRDGPDGLDTVARRSLGAVELIVGPDARGAGGEPATAWQRAAQRLPRDPLVWAAACVVSFIAGSLYGRRRDRGASDDPELGPDGRIPRGGA